MNEFAELADYLRKMEQRIEELEQRVAAIEALHAGPVIIDTTGKVGLGNRISPTVIIAGDVSTQRHGIVCNICGATIPFEVWDEHLRMAHPEVTG